jgi:hypothetical protein
MHLGHALRREELLESVARVSARVGASFGDFLDAEKIYELETSRSRSALTVVLRRHFRALDWRVRFVGANPCGLPASTVKLFSVSKALSLPDGDRLLALLDGGIVASAVNKNGPAKEWRIVGLHEFLPAGHELRRHEADLASLLRIYLRNPGQKRFPATTHGAFQIRTGPSGYDVYLQAEFYFEGIVAYRT